MLEIMMPLGPPNSRGARKSPRLRTKAKVAPATTPGIERLVSGIVYKGHTSALCLPGSKTMRTCYDITQPPAFPVDAPTPASNLPFQPIVCTVSTVRICEHRAVCEVVRRVVHHPGCDF